MANKDSEKYRRWFEYEKDSHARVLASLALVPNELQSSEAFQKALTLMAHIVSARWLWLYRLGAAKEKPSELFPKNISVVEMSARLEEMQVVWSSYLSELTDEELRRGFEYQSSEGPRYRNTIEDILTQLFGHSWYHRGQIASLLRSVGAEPAATDFVFWTRERVED